jgi:hypothetical protein
MTNTPKLTLVCIQCSHRGHAVPNLAYGRCGLWISFTATIRLTTLGGISAGQLTVTGTFDKRSRESGRISSYFGGILPLNCAASYPYTTKG